MSSLSFFGFFVTPFFAMTRTTGFPSPLVTFPSYSRSRAHPCQQPNKWDSVLLSPLLYALNNYVQRCESESGKVRWKVRVRACLCVTSAKTNQTPAPPSWSVWAQPLGKRKMGSPSSSSLWASSH
ncbi:hypothetical protein B0T26DRAFT_281651 [Lasiosphaeria miniovina]|uniref:Secreted protein n=1 Tax=Lasiosphaeria miniovina TaxID=1954250 RepID=A0AA40AJT7_9PEZI|nr:uncharacterized protein B0T26DRAFT_281651 [Lasiosphaeria miniovina]KAK0717119.1 hypothetical protein B0T26DRAFT_281651 [Lasiosphaeria miniovina]